MPDCIVCECEDFDLMDGFSYCRDCSIRNPDFRVEELQFCRLFGIGKSYPVKVSKSDWTTYEHEIENWTTTEAFNIILHGQCQALIELGVDPILKNVVLDLWVKYLSQCEQAFISQSDTWTPKLSSRPSKRDIQVLMKHPVKNMSMVWKGKSSVKVALEMRAKKPPKPRASTKRKRSIATRVCLGNAMQTTERTDVNFSLVALDIFNKWKDRELDTKKVFMKRAFRSMDSLTLVRVTTLLLLALRLIGSSVLVSDVARWIREGYIPYMEAYKLFPSSWKLLLGDRTKFREVRYYSFVAQSVCPTLQFFYSNMLWMAKFLDIRDPGLLSLKVVAFRIFLDINLPYECLPVLNSVIGKFEYRKNKPSKRFLVPIEMNAAFSIIITLKLIFGLDGSTERDLSSAARQKNQERTGDFFIWTDWKCQMEMFLKHLETSCPQSFLYSLSDSLNIESLFRYIIETDFGRCKGVRFKKTTSADAPKIVNFGASSLKKTYNYITPSQVSEQSHPKLSPSSFPLITAAHYLSDKLEIKFKDFCTKSLPPLMKHPYWLWPCRLKSTPDVCSESFYIVCKVLSAILQTDKLESSYSELGTLERSLFGISRRVGKPATRIGGRMRKKINVLTSERKTSRKPVRVQF